MEMKIIFAMNYQILTCVQLQEKLIELQFQSQKVGGFLGEFENPAADRQAMVKRSEELVQAMKDFQELLETQQLLPKLRQNYEENTKTAKFFGLIQENPEKPGTYLYKGDYDGRKEPKDPAAGKSSGENFTDEKFEMPSFEEILKRLTSNEIRLYNEMQKAGLEPKLQLTPIAKTIRSLGEVINGGEGGIAVRILKINVWDGIKDEELKYQPDSFEAVENGKKLKITGGKSKSAWIRENDGWLIEIVATKTELVADDDKKTRPGTDTEFTNAEKTSLYMKKALEKGFRGLTYESYLMAQMGALRKTPPEPLEGRCWTILPDSCLTDQRFIANGHWYGGGVGLSGCHSGSQDERLRFRSSVGVKKLGL